MKFITKTGKRDYKTFSDEIKICEYKECNVEFQVSSKQKNQKYCSLSCSKKGQVVWNKKEDKSIGCLQCNNQFLYESNNPEKKYCNLECYRKSRIGKPSPTKGFKFSEESKKKLSKSHKLRMTEDIRIQMRDIQLKRVAEGKHNTYKGGTHRLMQKFVTL